MNVDDLIEAVGYLACDLAKDCCDEDIQHDWHNFLKVLLEEPVRLTEQQLEDLRRFAA